MQSRNYQDLSRGDDDRDMRQDGAGQGDMGEYGNYGMRDDHRQAGSHGYQGGSQGYQGGSQGGHGGRDSSGSYRQGSGGYGGYGTDMVRHES